MRERKKAEIMPDHKQEPDQKLVELIKVQGDFEAQVLQAMLAAEGIEVVIGTGVTASVLPFTVDGLGRVRLYVRESDLEAARGALQARQQADPPDDGAASAADA
jgi:hypothetical protein